MSLLTGSARRSAYALQVDAEAIVKAWGYENTVFITQHSVAVEMAPQ
jgi:hypothetical protein